MHLFIVYIGGSHAQSFIELHDMRFVVANTIEETHETLRQSWWGKPESLHLDAWGILDYADGYAINISKEPPQDNTQQLYFVNLGGYDQKQFTELHKNVFVVAESEQDAKQKAVAQIQAWESPHRDYLYQADTLIHLNALLENNKYYIHLEKTDHVKFFEFTCCYTPIGK